MQVRPAVSKSVATVLSSLLVMALCGGVLLAQQDQVGQAGQSAVQGSVDEVVTAMKAATTSEDASIRRAAYLSLAMFFQEKPELVTLFIEAAKAEDEAIQPTIIASLAELESPPQEAVAVVIKYGSSLSASVRQAMRNCIHNNAEVAIPLLIEALQDDGDVSHRKEIATELGLLQEKAIAAVEPMLQILADENEEPGLRALAGYTAAKIAKANAASVAAANEQPQRNRQVAEQMIQQFDRDKDNRISRTEYPSRDGNGQYFFERMDANSDGFLTLEEIVKVVAAPRPGTGR